MVELNVVGRISVNDPAIDDFLKYFRDTLINYFDLALEDIRIMEVRSGSILIKALVSERALSKLASTSPTVLRNEFGISAIDILILKFDFRGRILKGANLEGIDLRNADLRNVDLREANLDNSILRLADLRGANLSSASLRNADLRGANLASANLFASNLENSLLDEANLEGANLRFAVLRGVNLRNTLYDSKTEWPSKWRP